MITANDLMIIRFNGPASEGPVSLRLPPSTEPLDSLATLTSRSCRRRAGQPEELLPRRGVDADPDVGVLLFGKLPGHAFIPTRNKREDIGRIPEIRDRRVDVEQQREFERHAPLRCRALEDVNGRGLPSSNRVTSSAFKSGTKLLPFLT